MWAWRRCMSTGSGPGGFRGSVWARWPGECWVRCLLDGLWALLAAGGVVLLTEGRGEVQLAGVLFALAAAACWACYILLSAALGRHTSDGGGLALGMALAAIVVAPVGIVGSGT